jgi:Fic family protein
VSLAERNAVKLRSRQLTGASAAFYTLSDMHRPPGRIGPILSRSPNEWINRVNQRHRTFAALKVTIDERRDLDTWLTSRFVSATLWLEQIDVAREAWARNASPAADRAPFIIAHLTNALREAMLLASVEGQQARLTPALLVRLSGAGLRTDDEGVNRSTVYMPAAHVARAVETACDWFAAESFDELNPVEQAAIVFLRLATIQPFEQASEATALVAASLFTLRAGLPPVTIRPEMQPAYENALVEAGQMNMQPLVELMAEAVSLTLDGMTEFVQQARGRRS